MDGLRTAYTGIYCLNLMTSKEISKIWASGNSTSCLVIPKKVALEHGLTDEDHVVVQSTKDGILIKRIDI